MTKPAPRKTLTLPKKQPAKKPPSLTSPAVKKIMSLGHLPPRSKK